MASTEFECHYDDSVAGTVSPGSSTENDFNLHQNLLNYGGVPAPRPGGAVMGADFLVLGGLETNASLLEWGLPFYGGTPCSWSIPTSSPGQEPLNFPLIPSPKAFEGYSADWRDQGCDSNGSSLLPSPLAQYIPSPPPPPPLLLPLLTPAPVAKKPRKRARSKRVAQPMRERRKIEKPEVCILCLKGFAYERDLDRHWRKHDRELGFATPGFKCPKCEVTIGFKYNLKRHVETQHSAGGPSP